MNAKLVPEKGL